MKFFGGAGHRSPYFSHAKRALYHLSYTPDTGGCVPCDLIKSALSCVTVRICSAPSVPHPFSAELILLFLNALI